MPVRSAIATAATPSAAPLPRWDVSGIYPALDDPSFATGFAGTLARIDGLADLFDAEGFGADGPTANVAATFERVLAEYNAVLDEVETLGAYLYAFVSTDSRDETAEARMAELQMRRVALAKLATRWDAWIGTLHLDPLEAESPAARDHAYPLRRAQQLARHQMPGALEDLAADLRPSGDVAWAKLYDTVTSQIEVEVDIDGERRPLPMTEVRNLAMSARRAVRRAGYEAELPAWERHAAPLAAALNGIKGQANVLAARRGWGEPLAEALFVNAIDREVLDAMIGASREAFPDFRRYLRAKARALGLEQDAPSWFDLFAPVGEAGRAWTWEAAVAFLDDRLGGYSDRMRGLVRRSVAERWIDVGPRPGKTGGAFCMWLRDGDSRILHNWTDSFDAVSTLAHELGHAYHNLNLRSATPLQRATPMALAETASTFCETIVREAVLAEADEAEQRFITEQSLQGATQVVVDIISRFDFERGVIERRRSRDLVISELCDLMREAQLGTYGDGLDPDHLHQWMWAAKGHYYIAGLNFYNFPYLFGLLFGLGLYARFREDPVGFRAGYDELLANTGRADAPSLAGRWGIDLRDPAFWRSSLDVVRRDIERFERLTAR